MTLDLIIKFVGYIGWITTTALGVGGSWFWNFTEDDPDDQHKKRLTPAGKRAVVFMVLAVLCAVTSTTYTEIKSHFTAITSNQEKRELQSKIDDVKNQNRELNTTVRQLLQRHGILEFAVGDRHLQELLTTFEPHIRGREQERQRLELLTGGQIPFGSLILFATFNLRDSFGKEQVSDRIQKISTVLTLMEADVIWLQEVRSNQQVRTLRKLLPQYDFRWQNVGPRQGGHGTGLAMLYRKATVELVGEPETLPAFSRDHNTEYGSEFTWYRVPFAQTVQIGDLRFQVVNIHLRWGGGRNKGIEMRARELELLQRWAKGRKSKDPIVVGGVFQWPLNNPNMDILRGAGWILPTAELPSDATESTVSKVIRRYSHFALSPSFGKNYISNSIRYQQLRPIYPDWTPKQWRNFADHNPLLLALRVE